MICDTTSNTDIIRQQNVFMRFECLYYLNIFYYYFESDSILIHIFMYVIYYFLSKEQPQSYCLLVKLQCVEAIHTTRHDDVLVLWSWKRFKKVRNTIQWFGIILIWSLILWSLSIILFYLFYYLIWLKTVRDCSSD